MTSKRLMFGGLHIFSYYKNKSIGGILIDGARISSWYGYALPTWNTGQLPTTLDASIFKSLIGLSENLQIRTRDEEYDGDYSEEHNFDDNLILESYRCYREESFTRFANMVSNGGAFAL